MNASKQAMFDFCRLVRQSGNSIDIFTDSYGVKVAKVTARNESAVIAHSDYIRLSSENFAESIPAPRRHNHAQVIAAFTELQTTPTGPMADASRQLHNTIQSLVRVSPDGNVAISMWGFEVVLLADGTYFINDTSGG